MPIYDRLRIDCIDCTVTGDIKIQDLKVAWTLGTSTVVLHEVLTSELKQNGGTHACLQGLF